MGICAQDHLSVQLQHQTQHTVSGRVLGSKVERQVLDRLFDGRNLVVPHGLPVLRVGLGKQSGTVELLDELGVRCPLAGTPLGAVNRGGVSVRM